MKWEDAPRQESTEALRERIELFEGSLRSEVLGRICTPGKDDERCMNTYGGAFQEVFDRIMRNDPGIVDRWDQSRENRDTIINNVKKEVELEVDAEDYSWAA